MEKLELKHIKNYLDTDLSVMFEECKTQIVGVKGNTVEIGLRRFPYTQKVLIDEIKPILRPLSDLTKVKQYKQGHYCIMSIWFSVDATEEEEYDVNGTIPEYWSTVIDNINLNGFRSMDYGFVNLLFEHHFDVFGLIPKGLAIDINTI